jgi:hypothetical protein
VDDHQSTYLTKLKHGGVSQYGGLAIYIKKMYLKAKEEELRELKYLFHHEKILS